MHKNVYLAGPVTGRTENEALDWRSYVAKRLSAHGINCLSPLRCEPLFGERFTATNPDPRFGTAKAIGAKNLFDVQQFDLTLAYLPKEFNPSYGTVGELAWAHAFRKPTVMVSDDQIIHEHPVIDTCSGWKTETLDDAIDIIIAVLEDYQ